MIKKIISSFNVQQWSTYLHYIIIIDLTHKTPSICCPGNGWKNNILCESSSFPGQTVHMKYQTLLPLKESKSTKFKPNLDSIREAQASVHLPGYVPGPEVIKLFSYSTQLSMKFIMLINVKMPTTVMINTTSESLEERKVFIFQHFSFYEQLKFHAARHKKVFYP